MYTEDAMGKKPFSMAIWEMPRMRRICICRLVNHGSSLGSHVFIDLHQRQSRCHKAHAHNVKQRFTTSS